MTMRRSLCGQAGTLASSSSEVTSLAGSASHRVKPICLPLERGAVVASHLFDRGDCQAQSPGPRHDTMDNANMFLHPLSHDLAAFIIGFAPFADTMRLLTVAKCSRLVLAHRTAWDPLVLSRRAGSLLLGWLRRVDPCTPNNTTPTSRVPAGLYRVSNLTIDVGFVDIISIPEAMRCYHPVGSYEALCERLRYRFSDVARLDVANIADYCVDHTGTGYWSFLELRTRVLSGFSHVRLRVAELRPEGRFSTTQALYQLNAVRGCKAQVPREMVLRFGSMHGAIEVDRLDGVDDLILEEHGALFKTNAGFHVCHAPQRGFSIDSVRQSYDELLSRRT